MKIKKLINLKLIPSSLNIYKLQNIPKSVIIKKESGYIETEHPINKSCVSVLKSNKCEYSKYSYSHKVSNFYFVPSMSSVNNDFSSVNNGVNNVEGTGVKNIDFNSSSIKNINLNGVDSVEDNGGNSVKNSVKNIDFNSVKNIDFNGVDSTTSNPNLKISNLKISNLKTSNLNISNLNISNLNINTITTYAYKLNNIYKFNTKFEDTSEEKKEIVFRKIESREEIEHRKRNINYKIKNIKNEDGIKNEVIRRINKLSLNDGNGGMKGDGDIKGDKDLKTASLNNGMKSTSLSNTSSSCNSINNTNITCNSLNNLNTNINTNTNKNKLIKNIETAIKNKVIVNYKDLILLFKNEDIIKTCLQKNTFYFQGRYVLKNSFYDKQLQDIRNEIFKELEICGYVLCNDSSIDGSTSYKEGVHNRIEDNGNDTGGVHNRIEDVNNDTGGVHNRIEDVASMDVGVYNSNKEASKVYKNITIPNRASNDTEGVHNTNHINSNTNNTNINTNINNINTNNLYNTTTFTKDYKYCLNELCTLKLNKYILKGHYEPQILDYNNKDLIEKLKQKLIFTLQDIRIITGLEMEDIIKFIKTNNFIEMENNLYMVEYIKEIDGINNILSKPSIKKNEINELIFQNGYDSDIFYIIIEKYYCNKRQLWIRK